MASRILIIATLPALLCSLLLLHVSAPMAVLVQQGVVFLASIALTTLTARRAVDRATADAPHRLLLALACLPCVPFLAADVAEPHRWIVLPGVRVYAAPLVLPLFLLLWDRALRDGTRALSISIGAAAAVALALFAQPDAAQLTAFAVSSIPILALARLHRAIRIFIITAVGSAAALSWTLPDPLTPVPYVEGVFSLAAACSGWFLALGIAAAAAPVMALWYVARERRSAGLFAAGVYFAVLYLLAPLQVTPVPLLGFGAAPIAGYFLMTWHASRSSPGVA